MDMVWASTGELKADTPRVAVLFDGVGADTSHVPTLPLPLVHNASAALHVTPHSIG